MLIRHANLVAGNSGSVVWFSDLLETSFTTRTSGKPNLVQIYAHMNADSHRRKVAIINEGAADAVGLLGKAGFEF